MRATTFILIAAVLDIMALGLVVPVLPTLIEQMSGSQAAAGVWNGIMVALWATMQFLFSPAMGALSDRFGRRPVILTSTFGLAATWVMMALAPNLIWLAAARVISGITSSSFTAINAYMADITPPKDRARAFGLIGAAFGGGFVLGPAVGGILGELGPRVPFWAAAGLSSLAFAYGLIVLPESLAAERRSAFSWKAANPIGALSLLRSHAELTALATVNLLLYFARNVFTVVYVLYAAHRHGLGAFEVGLMLSFAGVLDMLVQGLLVGRLSKRLGDRPTMIIGLIGGAAGMFAMGFVESGWLFAATLVPTALWGLATPTIQSLATRRVSERDQGQLQGANQSIAGIAGIASPLFFGWLYQASSQALPGLSFFVAATLLLIAAVVVLRSGRGASTHGRMVPCPTDPSAF